MKLYVWKNVLADWTDGIAIALANSPEEARQLIVAEMKADGYAERYASDLDGPPEVYHTPVGFYMLGGA